MRRFAGVIILLLLLCPSVFAVLTDFAFADRDTVIADGETIIYDYHFKIYRTDTIASWPIEVDDYENFACYIEGNTLPHSDSFAMAAVYYQSGTYDSLFSRIPGYQRSILDTVITDTIGQWHTFYPLLKYVKIYIYGDTIGSVANPVSTADSNTVRVRIRLSKWKGTRMRIPGTGVHAHHHDEFVGDLNIHGFVNFYADSVDQTRPALVYGYNSNHAYLYPDPGRPPVGGHNTFNLGTTDYRIDTSWTTVANVVELRFSPTVRISLSGGDFRFYGADVVPNQTNGVNLGISTYRWRQFHARSAFCDSVICDSLETISASIDTITSAVVFKAIPVFNADINFGTGTPDIGGVILPARPFGAAFGERLYIAGGLPSSFDTTLNLTVAASGTDCPALSIPNSDVGMTIKPGSWPFNIAGYLMTGIFFNSSGWLSFMGDNDEFFRIQLLGANKGDVVFKDNAATPAQKMIWDASTVRLRPAANHGANLGSGAYAFDTVYAADFATTTSMFSGTGDEALSILETVQALPGDRLDHEALDPYLTPSSPNTVSLNRWIALLTVAVQELGKKNFELEQRIEELSR